MSVNSNREANILRARELWRGRYERKLMIIRENIAARALRSARDQMDVLDARLGVNVGARKERRKLRVMLATATI